MGAIISKLCCCTGQKRRRHHVSKSPSKLSRNPSLIIERTRILKDDDGGSEYSRVLEKDFEIKGRRVGVKKSLLNHCEYYDIGVVENDSHSVIKTFSVKHKESGQRFTLTRLKKSSLSREAAEALCREIRLLAGQLPNHPMLVNLYWTWQDEKYLYRVDDDCGDDIEDRSEDNINISNMYSLERIASQLALVIHYIHSYGMIHGNINPHSIHFTPTSIKLGSFKYLRKMQGGKRLKGVCGDLEQFRAPECSRDGEGYFEEIDWYSYGKVVEYYSKYLEMTEDLKDLIRRLTVRESTNRLGYGPAGFNSIQSHPFFRNTDWSTLLTQKTDRKSFGSLSASIESLKSQTDKRTAGWREFVEFSWEEKGEIGQMLETIIKRI